MKKLLYWEMDEVADILKDFIFKTGQANSETEGIAVDFRIDPELNLIVVAVILKLEDK